MPHLAPLSWALAPILFALILLTLISVLWWSQGPMFPTYAANTKFSFSNWKWS
uniref:ATPase subunit 8 n=1 Tax=Marenzelleria neglecta TaxID=361650 RepID=A0A5Q0U078_MARNE|nr:ATPase subunit 8 [Marenzelleria neglecta]